MMPAAITVIVLLIVLVGGGIWLSDYLRSLRGDVDVIAKELGETQAEIKALKQRTGT